MTDLERCFIGSERYNQIKTVLDNMDKATKPSTFNPDAKI